jgi:hypothetical protein
MTKEEFFKKHPSENISFFAVLNDGRRLCRRCVELLEITEREVGKIEKDGICLPCQCSTH